LGQGGQGGQQQQLNLVPGQGYVPIGIEHSSYDPTDNSIIVEGTEDAIEQLRKTIELFDTAPKQVTIKVEFISTSSDLAKEIGYDWLYQRGSIVLGNVPGTFADAGNPIFASFSSGNVAVNMRTQLTMDSGKLVNAPIIRTLNNQPASVFTTTTTTLLLDSVVSGGNGTVITAPQLAQLSVTTNLTVSPRINRDGTVTMYLTPTYSDFGTVHQLPDGSQVPDTFSEGVVVVARVKNGETIVLGGLVHKNDATEIIKYPILGDLPIIGQFFRKTNINNTDTELLIFVTPTVIEDDTGPNQGV
jgi:general secretion pathway protein D